MLHPVSSLRSVPSVAIATVPMLVWLTLALSRPFKVEHRLLPFYIIVPIFQAIGHVMSFAKLNVVSQASQHLFKKC